MYVPSASTSKNRYVLAPAMKNAIKNKYTVIKKFEKRRSKKNKSHRIQRREERGEGRERERER